MRKIIRSNGAEIQIEGQKPLKELAKLINVDCTDSILLPDRVHVMLVDDDGHLKGLPLNPKATALYRSKNPEHATHTIVGDVAIVPDEDFE